MWWVWVCSCQGAKSSSVKLSSKVPPLVWTLFPLFLQNWWHSARGMGIRQEKITDRTRLFRVVCVDFGRWFFCPTAPDPALHVLHPLHSPDQVQYTNPTCDVSAPGSRQVRGEIQELTVQPFCPNFRFSEVISVRKYFEHQFDVFPFSASFTMLCGCLDVLCFGLTMRTLSCTFNEVRFSVLRWHSTGLLK